MFLRFLCCLLFDPLGGLASLREIFIHSITSRFSAFMFTFLRKRGWLTADPKRGLAQEANDFMIAVAFLDQHELAAFRIGTLNGENHDMISQLRRSLDTQALDPYRFLGEIGFRQPRSAVTLRASHDAAGHVQGHDVDEAVGRAAAANLNR